MRIAHATDIHWFVPPRLAELGPKRVLGTANLYVRGRRRDFSRDVQRALVAHLLAVAPDLVLITGDLTSQSLPSEFAVARQDLGPLLDSVPTFVIPGNHDVYTRGAQRGRFMEGTFGPWMHREPSGLQRKDYGNVTVLGLDPNRPQLLSASGAVPEAQLDALAQALADPALRDRAVILAIHYPLLDRRGEIYDGAHHGLRNARALIAVLDAAPVRPVLIACGHVHHGYRVLLELSDGVGIPICNPGTSGQAFSPDRRRAAAMAVYELQPDGSVDFARHVHDGAAFAPEPGGAWSSGR